MLTKRYKKDINKSRGVGMVELLVALVLSSLVAIVVIQLFIQNKVSYNAHENISRLQENGRYAIQLITQSLRSGDFWGCTPIFQHTTAVPDSQYPNVFDVQINGRVANVADVNDSIIAQDGNVNAWLGFPHEPDTISISGVYTGRSFPVTALPDPTGPITIDVTGVDSSGISANDLMIISDCNKAVLFQVTNDVDSTFTSGADPILATVQHSTTPAADPPTNYQNNFNDLGNDVGDYDLNAARVYHGFVGNTTFTIAMDDPDGDGTADVPTLMRNGQPIVPGVENLQVVWGVDTSGPPLDGQPDTYVNTAAIADWERVVSARVSLVVRSPDAINENAVGYTMDGRTVDANDLPDETGTINGSGKYHSRRVYSTTVTFRNRAP